MERIEFKTKGAILFIFLSLISNYLTIKLSYISGDIINKIHDESLMIDLPIYILRILGTIVLAMTFSTIKNSFKFHIVANEVKSFRKALYSKILGKDLSDIKRMDASYYHNLLYSDTETIRLNYFTSKLNIIDYTILLLSAVFFITQIHPLFLPIAIMSTFIPYFIPKLFEKRLDRQRMDFSNKSERFIAFLKEGVYGIDIIRDYNIENNIIEDFRMYNKNLLDSTNRVVDIQNIIAASSIFSGFFMYVFVLSCGVFFHSKGLISVGSILVASQLTNNIKSPIISIINNRIDINSTKSLRERIFPIIKEENRLSDLNEFSFDNMIEVNELSFSYDGENKILNKVNLNIIKGKKYLLIGESGSGKSTFLKILMKWYSDYTGQISVDGKKLDEIPINLWNKEFIPVLQETYLFNKPFFFNISLDYDYDESKLIEAIEQAGLLKYVSSLDLGINTIISEGGRNISGGEKKRIGIARALYRNGDVLLLDEPFSSLDYKTQEKIENRILKLKNKTILNISHNYNEDLIKKYDYVIYFKNGTAELIEASEYKL